MAMTKIDFIKMVQAEFTATDDNGVEYNQITPRDAESMINGVMKAISEAMKMGEKVKIYKFGSFKPFVRPSRNGRNPQNGASIVIQEKGVIKFKPSPSLTNMIKSALGKKSASAIKKPKVKKADVKTAKPVAEKKTAKEAKGKITAKAKNKSK